MMTQFVGLDVSQKMTAICVVDNAGRRVWRGQCPTAPKQIASAAWYRSEPPCPDADSDIEMKPQKTLERVNRFGRM